MGEVRAFVCGPNAHNLTDEDRAAIAAFSGFLTGAQWVCPVCLDPDDGCCPGARCCPACPGRHVTSRAGKMVARTMDGGH